MEDYVYEDKYRVIYEDPLTPEAPALVVIPTREFMELAVAGELPPINVYWKLQKAEEDAIAKGETNFHHNYDDWIAQWTAPRIPPLTEEEAIEYLILKDVPRRVWGKNHNRQILKIVKKEDLPKDRTFRDCWRME